MKLVEEFEIMAFRNKCNACHGVNKHKVDGPRLLGRPSAATQNRSRVGPEGAINSYNGQIVFQGLTHQHSIKRVTVSKRKSSESTHTSDTTLR
jgi:hypothetical protein